MQRYLTGRDAMNLQGYPLMRMKAASTFSENQLHDLAGNSFSTTVSLAFDLAVLFNVSYESRAQTDVQMSASLLHLFDSQADDDDDDDV